MSTFLTSDYSLPIAIVALLLCIHLLERFYYYHFTTNGRRDYERELLRRLRSHKRQIRELKRIETTQWVACTEPRVKRRQDRRLLRILCAYQTRAWIVLFVIRRL